MLKDLKNEMKGKIVLVTGGSAGIGKATCKILAKKGAKVILHAQNQIRGEAARKEIMHDTGTHGMDLIIADLSSQEQVRRMAEMINAKYECINVLINNAGVFYSDYKKSEDGIEMQWATNHLAPFMLTNLLLGKILNAEAGRIITVSSHAHQRAIIHFEDVNLQTHYKGLEAYAQSKLANVLFTNELARRLGPTHVTANALHPGRVNTDIGHKHSTRWIGLLWNLAKPVMITESEGARTSVYLACDEAVSTISGQYFDKCKIAKSSLLSYDIEMAKKLWTLSEEMTGVKFSIPPIEQPSAIDVQNE